MGPGMEVDPLAGVDWATCINLARRTDRWIAMQARYGTLKTALPLHQTSGVEIDVGHNPVFNGRAGCLLAHRRALKEGLATGAERFLVLEDDVGFVADVGALLARSLDALPADWDLCFLGVFPNAPLVPHGPHLARVLHAFGNHAILYSRRAAAQVVAELPDESTVTPWLERFRALDVYFSWEILPRLQAFACWPLVAYQVSGHSDIERTHIPTRDKIPALSTRPFVDWTARRWLWRCSKPARRIRQALRARHVRRSQRRPI